MPAAVVSPELALVDPELRADAVAELPRLEPYDFLRFDGAPRRHPELDRFGFLAEYEEQEAPRRRPPLAVAAAVYTAYAAGRVVVLDGLFMLALAVLVLLVNAFT